MSIETVGMENLPNVYFDEIIISPIDTISTKTRSKLIIKDYYNANGDLVWVDNHVLVSQLKIIFVASYSPETTAKITAGRVNLTPMGIKGLSDITYEILSPVTNYKVENKTDEVVNFSMLFDCTHQKNTTHLTLFACAFIDTLGASQAYDVHCRHILFLVNVYVDRIVNVDVAISRASNVFSL